MQVAAGGLLLGGAGAVVPATVPTARTPLLFWAAQPSGPRAWAEGKANAPTAASEPTAMAALAPARANFLLMKRSSLSAMGSEPGDDRHGDGEGDSCDLREL